MCGIIGIVSYQNITQKLLEGLKRLEYRGYDSAGIATVSGGVLNRRRAEGKIENLIKEIERDPLSGVIGIGHTRWATHGLPITRNAHPHMTDKVALVHNGIIENFLDLRKDLESKGFVFETDTDTEVIPHLITYYLNQGDPPQRAVTKAVRQLRGAYAIAIIFSGNEEWMAACRHGSPLALGYGDREIYVGSDALALAPFSSKITYLEEGDISFISKYYLQIFDIEDKEITRPVTLSSLSNIVIGKENYRHFMQKEIFEQPTVMSDLIHAYTNPLRGEITFPKLPWSLEKIKKIRIIACGTSYYAGVIARYWFNEVAKIDAEVEIASEFRYRSVQWDQETIYIFLSQSGETADTLAALRVAKENRQPTIAVVNVLESSLAREAELVLPIYSGPEIGVASTKAFVCQLVTMLFVILNIASYKKSIDLPRQKEILNRLSELPSAIAEVLANSEVIEDLAHQLVLAKDVLYIGRGTSYGLALEGALKLKEISYIHAEAAAAGELKHGSIALIDEDVPVVAIAPSDGLFEKTASNIREVAARGGKVILLSDIKGIKSLEDVTHAEIRLPECLPLLAPILYAVPIQLLAYHVAVLKGTDVDQPRNLAKSVTVE